MPDNKEKDSANELNKGNSKETRDADIKKYVNQSRIPEGLTPEQRERRIDYEIQLRKNIASLQAAIKANNDLNEPILRAREKEIADKYMADVLEADATLTGKERDDRLRSLSAEKDAAVQELADNRKSTIAREFSLTEDEIQAYLTPERMALMDRAKEVQKSQDERARLSGKYKDVPGNFSRVLFASVKHPNAPDAAIHNRHVESFIGNPNYRSQLDRRQLIIEDVNLIRELDSSKMSWDKSFAELADYSLDHMDACEIGYEFQSTHRNMNKAVGFSEREEFKDYLKKVEEKGVVLGGRGRLFKELLQDDSYMKLPFEQLDSTQAAILITDAMSKPELYGITDPMQRSSLGKFGSYAGTKEAHAGEAFAEPEKNVRLSLSSFEDHHPDLNKLSQQLESFEKQLDATDHWYNRRSTSNEYREMRDALQSLKDELGKLPTEAGDPQKMSDVENRFVQAVKDYENHVGKTPRNENQKLRVQAAAGLRLLVTEQFPSPMVKKILKSNALATPDDRAFYEKFAIPEQKPKTEKRELSEDVQQKLTREKELTAKLKDKGAAQTNGAVRQVYYMLNSARTTLSNELSKASPNPDTIKPILAAAVTCNLYLKELEGGNGSKPNPDMTVSHNNEAMRFTDMSAAAVKFRLGNETLSLMNSEAFKSSVKKITEDKLHQFLLSEDPSRTEIMRDICSSVSKQHEKPDHGSLTFSVQNKLQQLEPPQKAPKGLGK